MDPEPTDMEIIQDILSEKVSGAHEGCDYSRKRSAVATKCDTNPADPVLIYTLQMPRLQ